MKKIKRILLWISLVSFCQISNAEAFKKKQPILSMHTIGLTTNLNNIYNVNYTTNIRCDCKKLSFQIGARLTAQSVANGSNYYTADAIQTRGVKGIPALFKSRIIVNIDTVTTAQTFNHKYLNITFGARYLLKTLIFKKIKIYGELNFDLYGIGFGFKGAPLTRANWNATDHKTNTLLLGDNNRGALYSELAFRIAVFNRLQVNIGYALTNVVIAASNPFSMSAPGSQNFRHRYQSSVFGVSYVFRK